MSSLGSCLTPLCSLLNLNFAHQAPNFSYFIVFFPGSVEVSALNLSQQCFRSSRFFFYPCRGLHPDPSGFENSFNIFKENESILLLSKGKSSFQDLWTKLSTLKAEINSTKFEINCKQWPGFTQCAKPCRGQHRQRLG